MSQGTISQTNTEIVNRMVMECQSAGDLSLIDEFFSPDFVNHEIAIGDSALDQCPLWPTLRLKSDISRGPRSAINRPLMSS